MADAEMAPGGAGATGRRDEHARAFGPVPRPGSDGEHALQQRLGTATRADRFYDQQVLDHLNERMQEFAQSQEMFFLATADRHGECDNSFRAGPPGFLQVLDDRTLLYPEYRGNGVHASLGNLQENPHVGILMMDFLRARIGLHVNGRAEICEDAAVRAEFPDLPVDPVPGRRAQLWVKVRVVEAYIHCAKHIPHLQKVPKGAAREWGTDDHKRKGGDFFGAARDARERGPVEWQPREHEVPSSPPPTTPSTPATPAPVLEPGQVPAPPSVPPGVVPQAPGAPPVPGHTPAVAHQGPRHARSRTRHQTPVAAWRARHQGASRPGAQGVAEAEGPTPEEDAAMSAPGAAPSEHQGVPPQSNGHQPADAFASASYADGPYAEPPPVQGPSADGAAGSPEESYPAVSGPHDSYAAGWHTVGTHGYGPRSYGGSSYGGESQGPVSTGPVPPGVGAAVGASAVIAARGAVPEGEDPDAWRQEAERALADAERRAADDEPTSFQGWFG